MVHVMYLNADCKTIVHFDDVPHWNYKGSAKCPKCGEIFEIEVKEDLVIKAVHSHSKDTH